jgi:hypothetical protein
MLPPLVGMLFILRVMPSRTTRGKSAPNSCTTTRTLCSGSKPTCWWLGVGHPGEADELGAGAGLPGLAHDAPEADAHAGVAVAVGPGHASQQSVQHGLHTASEGEPPQ